MVMTDIYDHINALTPPLSREDIYNDLVRRDATITRGTVTKALKDLGYTTKRSKSATGCGICHVWVKPEHEPEPEKTEPKSTEPKSTEQIIGEVEERNEQTTTLNARLLETLQISRNLKQEMMEKQVGALVSMARMILAIHGDSYEQQRYRP